MTHYSFVSQYVDAAIDNLRRHDFLRSPDPDMPVVMRDQDKPAMDDWLSWKPIPSTVTDIDIGDLSVHFRGELPSAYVAFLKYRHFYHLTERGIRFEQHVVGRWKNRIIELFDDYQQHFPSGSHLIPFGTETFMDAGPVCFDFGNRQPDGDCPVVFWDHEWVNSDREIRLLFSSAAKMFESLLFLATATVDFCYHDPDIDNPEALPEKQKLLAEFLAIDAGGAGGPAREYWTCWGVRPEMFA